MPANPPVNEVPTAVGEPGTPPSAGVPSAAERHAAERTERRRQRAAAHKAPPPRARRLKAPTKSTSAPTPPRHTTLRDSVSISLIAVLVTGGVLGAILGALSVAGWVIGLLAAGLTVFLSARLRRYSRLT
jgi:Flp pilus assembly protein TadB